MEQYKNQKNIVISHIIPLHINEWDEYKEGNKLMHLYSGTCITISPNIIFMLKMIDLQTPLLYKHVDDVVLTYILDKMVDKKIHYPFIWLDSSVHFNNQDVGLFRIKNAEDRTVDYMYWKKLLLLFDEIEII